MRSSHILFILEYFRPHVGGAETLFDHVIKGLVEQGFRVTVLTSRYDDSLARHEQLSYGTHEVQIYRVGSNRYDFMRYGLWKGFALIRKHKIDIIQTGTYNAAVPAGIIRRWTRIPTVLHVHEVYVQLWYRLLGWKGFFYKMFERMLFQLRFDAYTCSSLYTNNSLRLIFGIPDDKLTTTYCGVDYTLRDPTSVDPMIIQNHKDKRNLTGKTVGLYVGRAGVEKGIFDYIRAIPAIVKQRSDFVALLIMPTDPTHREVKKIRTMIQLLHITDHMIWIEPVEYHELKQYMMLADVVVLPTWTEGFGLSIAETCALSRPLVTTCVGSVPEVVSGRIVYVEPGNASDIARGVIDALASNLTTIPPKKFERSDCVKRFVGVYENIRIR